MKNITKQADKKALTALCCGHFMVDVYASALVPLYPFIVQKLGINLATISLIIGLGHLTASMMQPFFGFLADQNRHRIFMILGLFCSAFFIPSTVLASTVWLFTLFLIFGMGGNALFHPQVTTLVSTFTHNSKKLTKYMGFFLGAGTIGYALGPVCSTYLVEKLGMHSIFTLTVAGFLVAASLYFTVPKIPLKSLRKSKISFFAIMRKILSSSKMRGLTFISVVKSIVSISFGTYMPFLLTKLGYSLEKIGIIITLFFTFAGIATMISSKLEKKIGAKDLIRISFLAILPLTLLFLWLFNVHKTLGLLVFVITGFFIFLSVSVTVVLAQRFAPENKGVASGVTAGFSWGLAAITLAPLGFFAQSVGVEKILIVVAIIAFLTGIFAVKDYLNE